VLFQSGFNPYSLWSLKVATTVQNGPVSRERHILTTTRAREPHVASENNMFALQENTNVSVRGVDGEQLRQ
jgi:hypothetical protein